MKNYSNIVEKILELKRSPPTPRRFQIEHNEYHLLRIQPTDIDSIIEVIEKEKVPKFDFSAELYCRTLLAQIIHSKYNEYFDGWNYENQSNIIRYQFVETVGGCPTLCGTHINPLTIPLLILYWKSISENTLYGSDNFSYTKALITLNEYSERFEKYKSEFTERIIPLFEFIAKANTPHLVKLEIINYFTNYPITMKDIS
jgi:hypothetical protein